MLTAKEAKLKTGSKEEYRQQKYQKVLPYLLNEAEKVILYAAERGETFAHLDNVGSYVSDLFVKDLKFIYGYDASYDNSGASILIRWENA